MNDTFVENKRTVGRGDDAREIVDIVPCYSLKDFLKMRYQPESYSDFFKYFLPAVGRKSFWRHLIANGKCDIDLATVSNEAFALLVMENHWERWLDIYKKSNGDTHELKHKRKTKDKNDKGQYTSSILPKYTRSGIIYRNKRKSGDDSGKGWSAKGIERFNELFDMVMEDRKENPEFAVDWIAKEKRLWKRKKKMMSSNLDDFPVARNELYPVFEKGEVDEGKRRKLMSETQMPLSVAEHLLSLPDNLPSDGEDMTGV